MTQANFSLLKEIKDTIEVVNSFKIDSKLFRKIDKFSRVLFVGEGSSRIFPAKNAISRALLVGSKKYFFSCGCYEAMSINLTDTIVLGASNSGNTKEAVILFEELKKRNIPTVGISLNPDSPMMKLARFTYVLSCGVEKAVAATKSVVEEALFFEAFVYHIIKKDFKTVLKKLYETLGNIFNEKVDRNIIKAFSNAKTIYFIGCDNGVGEELSIKTIEITGKKSFFIEGTRIFHGIEEILKPGDLIVILRPFASEEKNYERLLNRKVRVISINDVKTRFPTILIPSVHDIKSYVELFWGWKILAEVGLKLGRNIDKPRKVKKVGNPFLL